MNRGQGLFAGAILAAVLLIRPAGVNAPQNGEPAQTPQTVLSSKPTGEREGATLQEGPWLASCSYWAPARLEEPSPKTETDKPVLNEANSQTYELSQIAKAIGEEDKPPRDPGCGDDLWGFPKSSRSPGTGSTRKVERVPNQCIPNVTAIIATVPDPVHTHLAMTFDRTLDVILQAAFDNDYVGSHYWLPWPIRTGALKSAEGTGDMEPGHDPVRERQPGLVILKHVPRKGEDTSPCNSFYKVIFLFLVDETPTQGIDGFQLQYAFAYESWFAGHLKNFSTGKDGAVSIIGPEYSGSAASMRAAIDSKAWGKDKSIRVMGNTSTPLSYLQLTSSSKNISYYSFAGDGRFEDTLINQIHCSGYLKSKFAKLIEDNTTLGSASELTPGSEMDTNSEGCIDHDWDQPVEIEFPREISLLRNAEAENDQSSNNTSQGSVPSPYLHFSVKDSSAQDTVPKFSRENTPLSQEAQLMMIDRQLLQGNDFVQIIASNKLDEIFLARFLHRAYPDAQLILRSDNLMVRDVDNSPFIGSISIGPYNLMGLGVAGFNRRTYTDSISEGEYNAADYIFWQAISQQKSASLPHLQGYLYLQDYGPVQPPLWATAVGRDGYYPLGILKFSAGRPLEWFLPPIDPKGSLCLPSCLSADDKTIAQQLLWSLKKKHTPIVYSPLSWRVLAWLIFFLCVGHISLISGADYWSPLTRDLAVRSNDQPRRRSMYIQVATAALCLMAFVVSCPMLALLVRTRIDLQGQVASTFLLASGLTAMAVTFWKTRGSIGWAKARKHVSPSGGRVEGGYRRLRANIYFLITWLTWTAVLGLAIIWCYLCRADFGVGPLHAVYLEGASFSYRCIRIMSGVSPLPPVFLLLLSWYFWGFLQTWRLRFSESGRPHLTNDSSNKMDHRFLISDQDIRRDKSAEDALCDNIECLMFTSKVLRRRSDSFILEAFLASAGAIAILSMSILHRVRSIDHFLWKLPPHLSSPYEFLIGILLFPLIWLAFVGWLRLIFIWAALKSSLLSRLEDQPVRFAFDRLKGMGWMTMLSRVGLQEQWRDMDRCIESMCQMLHDPDFRQRVGESELQSLSAMSRRILALSKRLRERRFKAGDPPRERDFELRKVIDLKLAAFGRKLLSAVLIPYWQSEKFGLIESEQSDELPIKARLSSEPNRILMAGEFIAIRYMSLIRAVLANMRYLMTLVTITFVLTMLAWNSYPFHPREFVDWFCTVLLVILGSGMIWVFAQMHRDPILSRLTNTKPNVLGLDFYVRVVSYGAIPVLTWLAYEFPDVGSAIYSFIQPSTSVFK